jgi:hypothetical protein
MKIRRSDWTIRRGPDPTAIDGRLLGYRDRPAIDRINRRQRVQRRRRRIAAFLRGLWRRMATPEPGGVYPWGCWGFPATARVRRDNPVPDLAGREGRRGR